MKRQVGDRMTSEGWVSAARSDEYLEAFDGGNVLPPQLVAKDGELVPGRERIGYTPVVRTVITRERPEPWLGRVLAWLISPRDRKPW